jgi:GrpB-like predicted nucleotidyltransferase (UPF0157 family)
VKAASDTKLRVHLHAVERGGELWRNHLLFRDALRRDPLLCGRYQALKLALARQHATDKAAYTEAKAPFILKTAVARRRTSFPPTLART